MLRCTTNLFALEKHNVYTKSCSECSFIHYYPSCQLAYRAATKLLHPCLSLTSLRMVAQLWFMFFISTSTILRQGVFGRPHAVNVWPLNMSCLVAGVPSKLWGWGWGGWDRRRDGTAGVRHGVLPAQRSDGQTVQSPKGRSSLAVAASQEKQRRYPRWWHGVSCSASVYNYKPDLICVSNSVAHFLSTLSLQDKVS